MSNLINKIKLNPPYLLFLGDVADDIDAKTSLGLAYWRPELCLGQCRLGTPVDTGLPDMTPTEAAAAGARSLIVGVAPVGGSFPDLWVASLIEAAECGLDIVAGLHTRLPQLPGLPEAAAAGGARLIDIREPPTGLPIGMGEPRSGRRVLTVGTDCVVGKKYTALVLEREMKARGLNATFRATGQTGIMIAGEGIPIDAVVADFLAGAAEVLSPANDADHWDVIEGQGSLFHPGYAGVTLGLLHGAQPEAIVLCHDATRETIDRWPDYPIPDIPTVIDQYLVAGRLTSPTIRCAGASINTSKLPPGDREDYLRDLSNQIGLPCVDPVIDGVGPIIDNLEGAS
jgi:uncharacterized NAD-dependent epimerase/dehydratase family protein